MKRLFFKHTLSLFLTSFIVLIFFLPNALLGKFPIPADALLNLYHPWRDVPIEGYSPGKFPAKNTLITDPILQTFPWRFIAINNLKSGNFPLWNPYSFSGQPLLANIQSSPFQVSNILFFIFPFAIAWVLQIISPHLLLAIFSFLYLKKGLRLSASASTLGASSMPFVGFFISWSTWGTIVTTAVWLPLILLSLEMLTQKKSSLWTLVLIFSTAQTILSGHLQTAFYIFLAGLIYLLFKLKQVGGLKKLSIIVFGFLMGILISSVQILPTLEFINLSARETDQTYQPSRQDWFLPPQNIVQLIAPDFFGNPTTNNYWGIWNYGEFVSFVPITILFLAILAVLKRKAQTSFFLILAAVSLTLALPNPLAKIPYILNLPLISSLQPSRIIFLLDFSIVILAAIGLDYFLEEKKSRLILLSLMPIAVLIAIAMGSIFLNNNFPSVNDLNPATVALRNMVIPVFAFTLLTVIVFLKKRKISSHLIIISIFLLTIFELFRFAYKFTPFAKLSWIFPQTETLNYLESQEKPFRVMATDRRILHPNASGVYSIESIDGYDPLYLSQYAIYIAALQSQNPQVSRPSFNRIITPQKYDSALIDLLNTKYILTFDEIQNPDYVKVFQEGETKTYLNKRSLPRAFFVNEVIKKASEEEELASLLDKNISLADSATSMEFEFPKQSTGGQAKITSYGDQSIEIKTSSKNPAPLVLTNIDYPGWQAFLDGQTVKINKVDFMFQSVLVPAGDHTLNFIYKPQSFYNGLYLSLAGLTVTFAGLVLLFSLSRIPRQKLNIKAGMN